RVSKENFLADTTWLNEFKLKASYGEQGNDNLNFPVYTPYEDHYSVTQTVDTDQDLGYELSYKGNRDITWEKMKNLNAGFELALFNRRWNIDAEYFERNVDDMLFNRPVSPIFGYSSKPENIGSMTNKGFEVTTDFDVIRNENLTL